VPELFTVALGAFSKGPRPVPSFVRFGRGLSTETGYRDAAKRLQEKGAEVIMRGLRK
jgi:hypothetical protein